METMPAARAASMPDPRTWMRECVERARDGDREAFEQLFETFEQRLRARVAARLGEALRRRLDVDDVLQETFLGALQSIPRYRWKGGASFYNWLASISENILRNWADRAHRDRRSPLEFDVAGDELSQSRALRRDERFQRLQEALDELSAEHRRVIVLSRVEGIPLKEVAVRMKRSPSATSHLLMRAMKKLKDIFGETESLLLPPRRLDARDSDDVQVLDVDGRSADGRSADVDGRDETRRN